MFPALHKALADLRDDDRKLYRIAFPAKLVDGVLSKQAMDRLGFQAHPKWLARHFAEQSVREAIGAAALHTVASRLATGIVRDLVAQHARDEERHRKIFWRLCELHGGVDESAINILKLRREEETNEVLRNENFSFARFITDTHISEVNSLYHLNFISSGLPSNEKNLSVQRALSSLIDDEMHHVLYTARLCIHFVRSEKDHQGYIAHSITNFFKGVE